MRFSKILSYACNCFWLLLPVLAFNLIFTHQLPPAYQMDIFWRNIPKTITLPENILRMLVMIFPAFLRLRISTPRQQHGLRLYLAGLLLYFASWTVLIVLPRCAWSVSMAGFMAPAYTPIVWLAGIGLIGDELLFPNIPIKPWIYWMLSALFLVFHNWHTGFVYLRNY
jgi:hypothetical protein